MTDKATKAGRQQRLDHLQAAMAAAADHLEPDADLRFRTMFGGRGVYAHDRMFGSLSGVGLALKLSPEDHAEALALPTAKRLQYGEDLPVSKDKVVMPRAVVNDPAVLGGWVRRSVDFTRSQPDKPKRTSKARGAGRGPAAGPATGG